MSELAATATAGFPPHNALSYRMSLATPLATAVAVAVAVKLDTASCSNITLFLKDLSVGSNPGLTCHLIDNQLSRVIGTL